MISSDNTIQRQRLAAVGIPLLTAGLLFLSGLWPPIGLALLVAAGGVLLTILCAKRLEYGVYLLFILVAWFPEYAQTRTDVWTAADYYTLYNFRPIPQLTASVFDYIFLLVVLVWIFRIVLPHPKRLLKPPMLGRALFAFFGVCLFSLIYGLLRGSQLYYALREFRVSCYFLLVFLMAVTSLNYSAVRRVLPRLLLGIATISCIFGVTRHAMGIGREYYGYRLIYYDVADSVLIFSALLLLIALALSRWRNVHLFLGVLFLYTFVFSFRRGAWMGFAVGLLVVFFLRPTLLRKRFPLLKLGLVAALLLAAAVAFVSASRLDLLAERVASISDVSGEQDPSNFFRILDAMNALSAFADHPILGVGFGGRYQLKYFQEGLAPMEFWDNVSRTSHDGYLFLLYKTGLVGFCTYMVLMATFIRRWFSARRSITDPYAAALFLACGASFVAILVTNVTNPITDSLRPAIMLAFVMGAAAVLIEPHEEIDVPC